MSIWEWICISLICCVQNGVISSFFFFFLSLEYWIFFCWCLGIMIKAGDHFIISALLWFYWFIIIMLHFHPNPSICHYFSDFLLMYQANESTSNSHTTTNTDLWLNFLHNSAIKSIKCMKSHILIHLHQVAAKWGFTSLTGIFSMDIWNPLKLENLVKTKIPYNFPRIETFAKMQIQ